MIARFAIAAVIYTHVFSLSLRFGGLFGYVMIVWPASWSTRTVEVAGKTVEITAAIAGG